MLRFASLGSGSRGNATLVQSPGCLLLVDCGFGAGELLRRCAVVDVHPASLDALLVTHEHGDHIKGVAAAARRFGVPVWMTHGTWLAAGRPALPGLRLFGGHEGPFALGDIEVEPFPVPHDAREPVQFVFRARHRRLGMLTDTGSITAHVLERLGAVDGLLIECNHDPGMLSRGPYPPSLRARVGGDFGHLSNQQAAGLLGRIDQDRLAHLVAGHISEKNNTRDLVRAALTSAAPTLNRRLSLLAQDQVSGWYRL